MATLLSSRLASGAQTRPQRHPLAHVPGEDGWPIVGNTFAALRDPVGHAEAMYRKYGPVYRDSLFGVRSVALLGPDANELVLFDRDRNFSSSDGWGHLLDRLFPRGLMLMDFDEHRLHRKALGVAFKPAPMKAYLGALNVGISRRIAEWHLAGAGQGGTGDLRFYPAIKQLTLDLAATSFLGIGLGAQANAVNRAFVDMVAAITGVVRAPVPGTQMGKGVKGREAIVAFFRREIPGRRAGQATDLFSELCRATKEDGSLLADQEIADHMSFLMMAAHDTLTSSVTTLVYLLCKHPEWQDNLRAEMHGLGLPPGAPLPYERLGELALLEMAFKEAMRIIPPVPGIPRAAVRDFQFKGRDIPAGTRVAINAIFTHRMPEIWPEPLRFDPLRFTDVAVRARHKYAWVPFGGGAHMCLGLHFADSGPSRTVVPAHRGQRSGDRGQFLTNVQA
jgi:cytochrome P450